MEHNGTMSIELNDLYPLHGYPLKVHFRLTIKFEYIWNNYLKVKVYERNHLRKKRYSPVGNY